MQDKVFEEDEDPGKWKGLVEGKGVVGGECSVGENTAHKEENRVAEGDQLTDDIKTHRGHELSEGAEFAKMQKRKAFFVDGKILQKGNASRKERLVEGTRGLGSDG